MFDATGLLLLLSLGTDGSVLEICANPMPTCQAPAPSTINARQYQQFLGIDWLPTIVEPCAAPLATCISVVPQAPVLATHGLHWRYAATSASATQESLQRWEQASANRPAWTTAEKQWLARRHQPWLSAVALEYVTRFSSAVESAALTRDFDWSVVAQKAEATVLKAVPKDETARLFCPELRVTLTSAQPAVQSIEVVDRNGAWRGIDLPWAVPTERNEIQLVAGAISVALGEPEAVPSVALPPSPTTAGAIRFAAESINIELRPIR